MLAATSSQSCNSHKNYSSLPLCSARCAVHLVMDWTGTVAHHVCSTIFHWYHHLHICKWYFVASLRPVWWPTPPGSPPQMVLRVLTLPLPHVGGTDQSCCSQLQLREAMPSCRGVRHKEETQFPLVLQASPWLSSCARYHGYWLGLTVFK